MQIDTKPNYLTGSTIHQVKKGDVNKSEASLDTGPLKPNSKGSATFNETVRRYGGSDYLLNSEELGHALSDVAGGDSFDRAKFNTVAQALGMNVMQQDEAWDALSEGTAAVSVKQVVGAFQSISGLNQWGSFNELLGAPPNVVTKQKTEQGMENGVELEAIASTQTEQVSEGSGPIGKVMFSLGIAPDFVVVSYEHGIGVLNKILESQGHPRLDAQGEEIALRVYNAIIAEGGSSAEAFTMAIVLLDPKNSKLLALVAERQEAIESGEVGMLSVLGLATPGETQVLSETASIVDQIDQGDIPTDFWDEAENYSNIAMEVGAVSANPALMGLGAMTHHISGIVDLFENGPSWENTAKIFLGPVASWLGIGEERPVEVAFSTRSHQDDTASLERSHHNEDGTVVYTTGNKSKDAAMRIDSPFGITTFSMHQLKGMGQSDRFEAVSGTQSTLAMIRSIDERLANALNVADNLNGQGGVDGQPGLSMNSFARGLTGNMIKQDGELEKMNVADMFDNRYANIANRMAGSGTVAGKAFNAWMDGMEGKTINQRGEEFTFASVIAQFPVLLTLSPYVIERMLNTVEPGSMTHVVNQLTQTVGTYLSARVEKPMDENQLMDFTIEQLGLTEDYRFSAAPKVDAPESGEVLTAMAGIPQEVQDLVTSLDTVGIEEMDGGVALLGRAHWNDKFYQLVVDGKLDAYRYHGGDRPHFEKISRVIADLSGDYNNWPPGHAQGLGVDWEQLEAEGARNGNSHWVRNLEDLEVLRDMSPKDKDLLDKAVALGSDMQKLGKDVKVLGLSAFGSPGLVEVLIEGEQHAYKLEGDQFIQYSQRNLYVRPAEVAA